MDSTKLCLLKLLCDTVVDYDNLLSEVGNLSSCLLMTNYLFHQKIGVLDDSDDFTLIYDLKLDRKLEELYRKIEGYKVEDLLYLCYTIDKYNVNILDDDQYGSVIFSLRYDVPINLKYKRIFAAKLSSNDAKSHEHLLYRVFFLVSQCLHNELDDSIKKLDEFTKEMENIKKELAWFDKQFTIYEEDFREWAENYFNKNRIISAVSPLKITVKPTDEQQDPHTFNDGNILHDWLSTPVTYHQHKAKLLLHHIAFSAKPDPLIMEAYIFNTDPAAYIKGMKAAWSQKLHRDKNNGKKACSYMLNEDTITMLEKLCHRNRRKKNEMIEVLIENACEELGITKKPPRM